MFANVLNVLKARGLKLLWFIGVAILIIAGIVAWRMINKNKVIIDNPTDQAITFQLNGKDYTLGAKSNQTVKLPDGEHKITIEGEEFSFTKENLLNQDNAVLAALSGDPHAILNPTRSDYVLAHQMYGDWPDSAWPEDKFYEGELFFQVYADYGLNADLPHTLSLSKRTSYVVQTKIFRIEDYIKEFNIEVE